MTVFQKVIKYIAIVLAVVIIASFMCAAASLVMKISFAFVPSVYSNNNTETYEIESNITELDIDVSAAELSIVSGPEMRVESNINDIRIKEKNGVLTIKEPSTHIFGSRNNLKITLYIPENTIFESVDISTGAGKLNIEELSAEFLELDVGAGAVKIDCLNVSESADIDSGAGKFELLGGTINNAGVDIGVGEIIMNVKIYGISDINAGIGAASINLLGKKQDYCIWVNTGLGDVTVDGEDVNDGDIIGSGDSSIELDCGLGSITVTFEYDESDEII